MTPTGVVDDERESKKVLESAVLAAAGADSTEKAIEVFNAELKESWPRHRVSLLIAPTIRRCIMAQRKSHMQCEVAAAALAAERFRLEWGRWPETLGELVPEYMEAVPEDRFADGPIRYLQDEDGIRLYSVGTDGIDNGGLTREETWDRIDAGEAPAEWDSDDFKVGDLVFSLLEPELRGATRTTFREDVLATGWPPGLFEEVGYTEEKLREAGLTDEDIAELKERDRRW